MRHPVFRGDRFRGPEAGSFPAVGAVDLEFTAAIATADGKCRRAATRREIKHLEVATATARAGGQLMAEREALNVTQGEHGPVLR